MEKYSREKFDSIEQDIRVVEDDPELEELHRALLMQRNEALSAAMAEAQTEDQYRREQLDIKAARELLLEKKKQFRFLKQEQSLFSELHGVSEVLIDPPSDGKNMQVGLVYPSRSGVEKGDFTTELSPDIFVCEVDSNGTLVGFEDRPQELAPLTEADMLTEVARYIERFAPANLVYIKGPVLSSEQGKGEPHSEAREGSRERYIRDDRTTEILRSRPDLLFVVQSNASGFASTYDSYIFEQGALLESSAYGNAMYYFPFDTPLTRDEYLEIQSQATEDEQDEKLLELLNRHGYDKYAGKSRAELRDLGLRISKRHPTIAQNGRPLPDEIVKRRMEQYVREALEELGNQKKTE